MRPLGLERNKVRIMIEISQLMLIHLPHCSNRPLVVSPEKRHNHGKMPVHCLPPTLSIIDLGLNLDSNIFTASAGYRQEVTLNHLSKLWRIGIEAAKITLEITTQLRKQKVDGPLTRIYLLTTGCYDTNLLIHTSSQTHSLSQIKQSLLVVIRVCNYVYQIKDLCLRCQ